MSDMAGDSDVLRLSIRSDPYDADSIQVFMSDAIELEVLAELDRAGLNRSQAMMHSDDPQLVLHIVELAGQASIAAATLVGALTAALRTYLRRNDGRKVKVGDVELVGYSAEEIKSTLTDAVSGLRAANNGASHTSEEAEGN